MTLALSVEQDYDWWFTYQSLNKSDYVNSSVLSFNNKSLLPERAKGDKVILKSENNQLKFKADSFKFGDLELCEIAQKTIEFSLGISGFGFPEDDYMKVAKKLYNKANTKIICPSSYGGTCHSNVPC